MSKLHKPLVPGGALDYCCMSCPLQGCPLIFPKICLGTWPSQGSVGNHLVPSDTTCLPVMLGEGMLAFLALLDQGEGPMAKGNTVAQQSGDAFSSHPASSDLVQGYRLILSCAPSPLALVAEFILMILNLTIPLLVSGILIAFLGTPVISHLHNLFCCSSWWDPWCVLWPRRHSVIPILASQWGKPPGQPACKPRTWCLFNWLLPLFPND